MNVYFTSLTFEHLKNLKGNSKLCFSYYFKWRFAKVASLTNEWNEYTSIWQALTYKEVQWHQGLRGLHVLGGWALLAPGPACATWSQLLDRSHGPLLSKAPSPALRVIG